MPAHEDVEETDAHVSTRHVKIVLSRLSKHMADNLKKKIVKKLNLLLKH